MPQTFFTKTRYLGKHTIYLPKCRSTNAILAKTLNNRSLVEGTTVITQHQTNGKGQRGNTWEAEPNQNITCSILLKPTFITPYLQFHLHIITTLAIYCVLFDILGKKLKIKWPNDIYYGNKKIGGILIENNIRGSKIENSVIGIGININQKAFNIPHASSLREITRQKYEIFDLMEKILIQLEKQYSHLKSKGIFVLKKNYERRLYQLDEDCNYESFGRIFSGKITGVDREGKLQILENQLLCTFDFKEVSFL